MFTGLTEVFLLLSVKLGKEQIQFFVRDTGIGISEKNQKLIFDNFIQEDNTATREYEGSGLGLSIAKKFVEFLDGQIWLESEKGKGSVPSLTVVFCNYLFVNY